MASISITETVLRDGNQSFMATRMPLKAFEPILSTMDEAGYSSIECWGGATFDSCLRYLNEDPWERLNILRSHMPNSKLQMLLRGRNLLGYQPYPEETIRSFIRCCVKNGIDIIRIFDALNDIENITAAVDETIRQGAHASGTICYTISPVHTLDNYVTLAKQMEAMAPDETSFFIRDAGCIRKSQAVVLIGTRYSKRGLDTLCGLCNYSGCADCTEKGAVCVFDPMDLGIAIGSAVSSAADYRVDTRVMFSAGMAAKALGFLGDDVKAVMAIPVSVSGKSPFFDR